MTQLLKLAQELDWQVMQVRRAHPDWAALAPDAGGMLEERQKAVLTTTDKIQRELLATVKFDPLRLVGVGGPITSTLDGLSELLVALNEVRQNAITSPGTLPASMRSFQGLLQGYCNDGAPSAA
jgi:hypothetical protein